MSLVSSEPNRFIEDEVASIASISLELLQCINSPVPSSDIISLITTDWTDTGACAEKMRQRYCILMQVICQIFIFQIFQI